MVGRAEPLMALYGRIRVMFTAMNENFVQAVNPAHVGAQWGMSREIVESEQRAKERGNFDAGLLARLSA